MLPALGQAVKSRDTLTDAGHRDCVAELRDDAKQLSRGHARLHLHQPIFASEIMPVASALLGPVLPRRAGRRPPRSSGRHDLVSRRARVAVWFSGRSDGAATGGTASASQMLIARSVSPSGGRALQAPRAPQPCAAQSRQSTRRPSSYDSMPMSETASRRRRVVGHARSTARCAVCAACMAMRAVSWSRISPRTTSDPAEDSTAARWQLSG